MTIAIEIERLSHRYGERLAVDDLSLEVRQGELFAFLGPNGSGKTTLFRLLTTYYPVQQGGFRVLGRSHQEPARIRPLLGIVFQSPSIDGKLTVRENIQCHAALYGLPRTETARRLPGVLEDLGLAARERERVESLSGGLQRRVELAKCLLHQPQVLLMDEPSTGLDPGARIDLWNVLQRLRREHQVTIAMTTHLLEEAEKADRVAIMNHGRLAAAGAPQDLKAEVGGESLVIETAAPAEVAAMLRERFSLQPDVLAQAVRVAAPQAASWVPRLAEACGEQARSITVGRPTLEDVFIQRTGKTFWSE